MHKKLLGALAGLALFGMMESANATLIYESATLGTTGITGGFVVTTDQFLGSRFTLTDTFEITSVGGHIGLSVDTAVAGETGFAAIIELDSLIPTGFQFDETTVLATAVFAFDTLSHLELIPISVTLVPGDYALVFGSGLFGSSNTGSLGTMPTDTSTGSVDLVDGAGSYFFWQGSGDNNWVNGGLERVRFEVSGTAVAIPEPSTLLLFGVGLTGMAILRRRKRKNEGRKYS